MEWGGITYSGKTPLVFIDKGVKINKENCVKDILESVVVPWSQEHLGNQRWTYQQDSAPAHRTKQTQAFCKDHFLDFISSADWPSYSPDLNPLDPSVWSVLEASVCSTPHRSVDSLNAHLQKAWDDLSPEYLRATVDGFV